MRTQPQKPDDVRSTSIFVDESGRRRQLPLWLLNMPYPGLGNVICTDLDKASCGFCIVTFVALVPLVLGHMWSCWLFLYLVPSVYGSLRIAEYNRDLDTAKKMSADPYGRSLRFGSSKEIDDEPPNSFLTDDFRRKLEQADREILLRHEAKQKALEKAESAPELVVPSNRQKPVTEPHDSADLLGNSSLNLKKNAAELGELGTVGSYTYAPADLPEPAEAGTVFGGNSIILPGVNSPAAIVNSLGVGNSLLPPGYCVAAPGTVGDGTANGGASNAARPACKRCGTVPDHDFSFCLNCGHSYDLA